MKNKPYFLTVIMLPISNEDTRDGDSDISDLINDGDIVNREIELEEGIEFINNLMHEENPEGFQFNFFIEAKNGRTVRVVADEDGWFKFPVYRAMLTREIVSNETYVEICKRMISDRDHECEDDVKASEQLYPESPETNHIDDCTGKTPSHREFVLHSAIEFKKSGKESFFRKDIAEKATEAGRSTAAISGVLCHLEKRGRLSCDRANGKPYSYSLSDEMIQALEAPSELQDEAPAAEGTECLS